MLEGLVAWVLNNYLGKYVKNLNTHQLSIALLQGEVELENLPLKKEALWQVGLPVQVRAGFIGKVKLQIPFRQIRSAPWVIVIEQLYVVAGPYRLSEWDEETEQQAAQSYKLSLLDDLEAKWRAEAEAYAESSYYASTYSSWLSYGAGLVTNIVENLQLKVKDVHLRYEDDETSPGSVFAMGITIGSLTAQSCDDKWMPCFTSWDASKMSYKVLELNTLAVYWDSLSADQLLGGLDMAELAVAMSQCATQAHQFVLAPTNAQAYLKRNRSEQPLRSRTQPRIACDLHLEEVPLFLCDWQYGQMVACLKGLQYIDQVRCFRKWRPFCSVTKNPRAWWIFAVRCHIPNWSYPRSSSTERWKEALSLARGNVAYVKLYSSFLANPGLSLPPETKLLKDTMELERGFEELCSLRECAMRMSQEKSPLAAETNNRGRGVLIQWFPQWWGWYSSTGSAADTGNPLNTSSGPTEGSTPSTVPQSEAENLLQDSNLEDEILDALADSVENNTLLRRDTIFGQFNFTLKKGAINLCTSNSENLQKSEKIPLMELQFESVQLGWESRPRAGSHKFHLVLGAVYLHDHLTEGSVFPVLVAPQARDSAPSALGRAGRGLPSGLAKLLSHGINRMQSDEPLFKMTYEFRPFSSNVDYRLHICSQSLDVVYNPTAVKWLSDFFTRPHHKPDSQLRLAARNRYEMMKQRTKEELMKNWSQILEGDLIDRKIWDIELDISAPQIILVEQFCDKNALIVVVDFGRFHFSNQTDVETAVSNNPVKESEEEDEFQTPCSTPPGSEASESDMVSFLTTSQGTSQLMSSFTEQELHKKLYDRFNMELCDMQILVGRVRDNWKFAHLKGTSTLHVLDRFNISLLAERRVVFMNDPQFPSLRLTGNLPKLVVHVNEQKVDAFRTIATIMKGTGVPSPFRSSSPKPQQLDISAVVPEADASVASDINDRSGREQARLLTLQFSIDEMALEVQSRGRSVAELQVSGVRTAYTKRPFDTTILLSVHSLLLVDALQTFGPDFELLVASHKHVGMDSVSGSLRDSEPTSPTSPGSPDPAIRSMKATSPVALTQALSNLQAEPSPSLRAVSPTRAAPSSPPHPTSPQIHQLSVHTLAATSEPMDSEALITIEICFVNPIVLPHEAEALQTASVQFNNLDIIANQETIVELVGFARRVFPQLKPGSKKPAHSAVPAFTTSSPKPGDDCNTGHRAGVPTRTELMIDFHRLNILLLRAVVKDGTVVGRKIATATMSEAMIQATVGRNITVQGSLGGLQVLDLTPEGQLHQRILSLGKDPLVQRSVDLMSCLNDEIYSRSESTLVGEETRAFSFRVHRSLDGLDDCAEVNVRMASVWYTHSPRLLLELQSCASEFKQYLSNLARSIRSAATEMAMGLVHARAEALAQSLSANSRFSSPFYSGSFSDMSSPRRRRRSASQSSEFLDGIGSTRGTTPHTPYSPSDDDLIDSVIDVRLDIILDSPVVVVPQSPSSTQVFVAHLGKISITNSCFDADSAGDNMWTSGRHESHDIEIRDMNLYSLNITRHVDHPSHSSHPVLECPLERPENMYSCEERGKPILHDTVIRLAVDREIGRRLMKPSESILIGQDTGTDFCDVEQQDTIHVSGRVETPLKVSLSRQQYEQLLDTLATLMATQHLEDSVPATVRKLANIEEEEEEIHTGVSTLSMDPALLAKRRNISTDKQYSEGKHTLVIKVFFDLPVFTVELKGNVGAGERGLVDLSFEDFNVKFDHTQNQGTTIQMSLRSLMMEDLTREPDSKDRCIVTSSAIPEQEKSTYLHSTFESKSCPDIHQNEFASKTWNSLPSYLETESVFGMPYKQKIQSGKLFSKPNVVEYPCTPPPSPHVLPSMAGVTSKDNLVHINVEIECDPLNSSTVHRSVNVDFNSLDVVVNMESWVVVLDFFGIGSSSQVPEERRNDLQQVSTATSDASKQESVNMNSEFYVKVRSLTLIFNRAQYEVTRANISHLTTRVTSCDTETSIEGRLGSMSLIDLSPHGRVYRERFVSSGTEALNFHMLRYHNQDPDEERDYDAKLKLEMSSVIYVHTRRFVSEIVAFFQRFSQLQGIMASLRSAAAGYQIPQQQSGSSRLQLDISAGSPVILLPLSSHSTDVLVMDLGKLNISNCFKLSGSVGTISGLPKNKETLTHQLSETSPDPCLLDVMQLDLMNMDLYAGQRVPASGGIQKGSLQVGSFCICKHGPPLLREKCHLGLQIDRNLETYRTHHVPDFSVKGTLSALDIALDVAQYKLIRGFLTYNLGESIEDLEEEYSSSSVINESVDAQESLSGPVWSVTSINLDLVNVMLKLQFQHKSGDTPESSLAGINFIKSHLMVEIFSDGSRDVDLISQEFLITDTRFQAEPANIRANVFTNILQPVNMASKEEVVQAEIHHRHYHGFSKFTVLLKDMRLMVILDWWEAVRNFLMQEGFGPAEMEVPDIPPIQPQPSMFPKPSTLVSSVGIVTKCPPVLDVGKTALELKLNITSSDIVFVQDTSVWDTNAVILKSNSVILYRPQLVDKPLSCDLNNCELFSCILGMEDETALSIVDPVQLSIEVLHKPNITGSRGIADAMNSSADRVLEVHVKDLTVRLSYHDMCMFMDILKSLPSQTLWARSQDEEDATGQPANVRSHVSKLTALGFSSDDCQIALKECNDLDAAALWLTQNAVHTNASGHVEQSFHEATSVSFESVLIEMNCVCVVVIDDCRDADVPLLELSLSRLQILQRMEGPGTATCQLCCDYYNRDLSGWEPFIEPWGCEVNWKQSMSSDSSMNKLEVRISSEDLLNINITSTLIDLYTMVKENWMTDYDSLLSHERRNSGSCNQIGSPPGYRRRMPFVPYAIVNNTGSRIWFTTHITKTDCMCDSLLATLEVNESWVVVPPGDTVPFTFEGRGKMRHRNTHEHNIHQLGVKVEGFCPVTPVSVDKVGIYFRQAHPENQFMHMPQARVVFEVTLEGSAKKLVTVRSALLLNNKLQEPVEVKMENVSTFIAPKLKFVQVAPGSVLPIPLSHVMANLKVRPVIQGHPKKHWYQFTDKPLDWNHVTRPAEVTEEPYVCHGSSGLDYRFSVAIRRENYPVERLLGVSAGIWTQPAHTITLLSPLTIYNLLPHELQYTICEHRLSRRIRPGEFTTHHQVDMEKPLEIEFRLESYACGGAVVITPFSSTYVARVRMFDEKERRLLLRANVVRIKGESVKILVSAPYWLVNKTGLPLVFRQEGLATEAAGQSSEHEVARMVAPLLFSYEEGDNKPYLNARVGTNLHPDGNPQWSKNFSLHKVIQSLQLRVTLRDDRPDVVYEMGISVRRSRGRYCSTSVVTLMPRFQLHNKSRCRLQFSQRCYATTLNDPGARATYLTAVPECSLPFHWPRLDKDQLLCVRILDVQDCMWSGGFLINSNNSMFINVRDARGRMFFLRAEVVLQGATYFIVFTDADTMPPPLRVDNLSAVPLQFYQFCAATESLQVTVRPNSSVPYALDEPTQPAVITVQAPGGASASYDMNKMGPGRGLTYENFIYIAFTGTFSSVGAVENPIDIHCQQLVLDVPKGSTKVILAHKEQGKRSQLWRMTGEGHLQHEGSSPPQDPRAKSSSLSKNTMVLDIAAPALQPSHYVNLEIRRPDQRRISTQTWRFTEDGRLCCAHNNMCVQAKDGFFGVRKGVACLGSSWKTWNEAVLGPPQRLYDRPVTGVPLEQAVGRQRLRPGSGFLAVRVLMDGPTAVLQITDLKENVIPTAPVVLPPIAAELPDWPTPMTPRPVVSQSLPTDPRELQVELNLPAGLGISLVARSPPEELLYIHLTGIHIEALQSSREQTLAVQVRDIQVDNQLLEAQCPVVVSVCPPTRRDEDDSLVPTLEISAEKLPSPNENVEIFKHLNIRVKNLSVIIEERLLLKLFDFVGYTQGTVEAVEESDVEMQRIVTEVASVHAKRYYFGNLCLEPSQVRLSVITSSKLPPQLQAIKRKLNLTLIKFEDAAVDLKPFIRVHPFESSQFLVHSIIKYFKDELKWQAAIILGSVDFLGNPLGLVNDVSEGMSGLIFEGNVTALFKNVTHGLSNSAAKVTESLSDGLGRVIMDDQHEETRQRIRTLHTSSSGDHLVAGLKGLGFGLLGGVTSVFKQTYEGATTEGMQGFISGLGKGLVGTVTKPVVGVLDLASEAASAVRDSSRTSNRVTRRRFRSPRCVPGTNGLLPPYDKKQSEGQELLHMFNKHDYSELLILYDCILSGVDGLRILITTEKVRVFTMTSSGTSSVVLEEQLSELERCTLHQQQSPNATSVAHYIELNRHDKTRRPRVRCDNSDIAKRVSHAINYAKCMFEERRLTVLPVGDNIFED